MPSHSKELKVKHVPQKDFNCLDQVQVKTLALELNDEEMFIGSTLSFDIRSQREVLECSKGEKNLIAFQKRFGI